MLLCSYNRDSWMFKRAARRAWHCNVGWSATQRGSDHAQAAGRPIADGRRQIADGKFETRAAITKYRVSITSVVFTPMNGKKIDKFADSPQFKESVLVPPKYNSQSKLELDVTSGVNEPHFDLKSK